MGPGNRRTDNSSKRRITIALALSSLFLLTAGTSTASAARGLLTGFADFSYQSADPAIRSSLLDRTLESGAGLVRLNVPWSGVARVSPPDPANPGSVAYDFSVVDPAVREARARGLTVMLNVSGAPSWAEGSDRPASATPGTWKPSPTSLAAFMRAVTARYSGGFDPDGPGVTPPLPAIQAIQVWNEPNLPDHLAPQYQGPTPFMPDYYRRMLNDSYSAVKAVNPSMLVVTGGTGPYGGPSLQGPRSRPVAFDRLLLCVRQVRNTGKGKRRKMRAKFIRAAGC